MICSNSDTFFISLFLFHQVCNNQKKKPIKTILSQAIFCHLVTIKAANGTFCVIALSWKIVVSKAHSYSNRGLSQRTIRLQSHLGASITIWKPCLCESEKSQMIKHGTTICLLFVRLCISHSRPPYDIQLLTTVTPEILIATSPTIVLASNPPRCNLPCSNTTTKND